MTADSRGIAALRPLAVGPDRPVVQPVRPISDPTDDPATGKQPAVPQQSIPATASALPLAETALRRVLASQGPNGVENPTATALDLLRSVEALLQASAPTGTPAEEIGDAAARLVERQGLLARLSDAGSGASPVATQRGSSGAWDGPTTDDGQPSAVDTRL